jgi:hypothetical protein
MSACLLESQAQAHIAGTINLKLMKAVITGDIINSRNSKTFGWIDSLKTILSFYGKEPADWEIFRGDSFQLMLEPERALLAAFHIKAVMKAVDSLDVRMGIGVGDVAHQAARITESNGEVFVLSGSCFEGLKNQTVGVKTSDPQVDKPLNVMLRLARLVTDDWTSVVSHVIRAKIEHPQRNQKELAALLRKSQSSISDALKRGGWDEVMLLEEFYREQITCL